MLSFFNFKPSPKGVTCYGTLRFDQTHSTGKLQYKLTHRISINDSNTGADHIRGEIVGPDKDYTLIRTINFNYLLSDKNLLFNAKVISIRKSFGDNVPPELISSGLPYLVVGETRIFNVQKLNTNLLLFSSEQGPYLICNQT